MSTAPSATSRWLQKSPYARLRQTWWRSASQRGCSSAGTHWVSEQERDASDSAATCETWIRRGAGLPGSRTHEPPPSVADRLASARKAIEVKDWNGALSQLETAARAEPRNAEVHNLLGYSYRKQATPNLAKAFEHYNTALRLDPRHKGAHEYIGEAYLMDKKPAEAEKHLAQLESICGNKTCPEYADLAKAMTPHEALSLMFAQRRAKFDTRALQVMIRCLGVYPPGTVVKLSNDAIALVSSVNPAKPLRPWVTVYDASIPKDEAIMLDLEEEPDINIAKALRPIQLPAEVYEYLSPRKRVTYYFDADSRKGRTQ